jgi:hypothetical protein
MLMDTQQVLNNFTTCIATHYEYRQAVLNSNLVSVDAHQNALQSGQAYINKIYIAEMQMAMDQYNDVQLMF